VRKPVGRVPGARAAARNILARPAKIESSMRFSSRLRLCRWFTRRLSIVPLISVLVGWPLSSFLNAGFGVLNGSPAVRAWGPGAASGSTYAEITLMRGGLLLVINGTRTDDIFEGTGGSSWNDGWPVYFLLMEKCSSNVAYLPRYVRPAAWCGPYIVIPWWLVLLPSVALARWGLRRRPIAPGKCEACGYSLAGLSLESACPECGSPRAPGSIKPQSQRPSSPQQSPPPSSP
jgi:hypothetical protein